MKKWIALLLATHLLLPQLANAVVVRYEGGGTMQTLPHAFIGASVSLTIDYDSKTLTQFELDSDLFSLSLVSPEVLDIDIYEYDSGPYQWTLNVWDRADVFVTDKATAEVSQSEVIFDWLFFYHPGTDYLDLFSSAGPLLGVNAVVEHFYFYPSAPGTIISPAEVPEPSTLALFGLGLAFLGFKRRKT